MASDRLSNYILNNVVPQELYQLEPGKVFLFIPRDGINATIALNIMNILDSFPVICQGEDVDKIKLNLFPTDNEILTGNLAARIHQEDKAKDRVVISTPDTLPDFTRIVYGSDEDKKWGPPSPIVIELPTESETSNDSDFDIDLKIAKPERGSLAEKKLIAKEEKKLEKILRECAVLGIELDIDRIKEKVANDLRKSIDYKLIIKKQRNNLRPLTIEYNTYDIYVAEGEEYKLDLTGIEKAVYLTYLLYMDGLCVEDTFGEFREITKRIYVSLPFADKNEKESGGIRDAEGTTFDAYTKTLRGYFTNIRDAVADKVADPLVAQDFAIEGFKGAPFGIAKTTPEIIAQIKEDFML